MAAPKGTKPPGGSRKGCPNKATKDLKEMILTALTGVGGVDYLQRQANENPASFLTLIGKVIPTQVNANVGGKMTLTVVTGVPRSER